MFPELLEEPAAIAPPIAAAPRKAAPTSGAPPRPKPSVIYGSGIVFGGASVKVI